MSNINSHVNAHVIYPIRSTEQFMVLEIYTTNLGVNPDFRRHYHAAE